MRHPQRGHPAHRGDAPARARRDDRVQVAHVAGDIEGSDLALAVEHLVEAAGEAARDEAGVLDMLARRDDVLVRAELLGFTGEREERFLFLAGQHRPQPQAVKETRQRRSAAGIHRLALRREARARRGLPATECLAHVSMVCFDYHGVTRAATAAWAT